LRVLAYYKDFGNVEWLVLFESKLSTLEKQILGGDYLVNRGPIEQKVLLNLYPPISKEREAQREQKRKDGERLLETRIVTTDQERRMLARALDQSANLSAFRGDNRSALNGYWEVLKLLEPLVLKPGRSPNYVDGELFFRDALHLVSYFTDSKNFNRARDYLPNLLVIAERMIVSDPDEPEYLRWRARGYWQTAVVMQGSGSLQESAAALKSYVETERDIHRKVANAVTRQDLIDALERSAELSDSLRTNNSVLAAAWRQEALSLKQEMQRLNGEIVK